ncbi:cytochrome b-c1 complex subunit 2, mitochondrial, partial [Trichonephila clavata]
VTATRDHLIYNLKGSRDSIDKGLAILADIKQPESVLLEALHKAAFRGGLSNSLFSEPFMIGKHNPDMCHSFVRGHFTASRTSIVGLGIAHEDLEGSVGEHFNFQGGAAESDGVSKFSPGEIRIEADIPLTYAAVVAEGAGATNVKDMLSLGVLQCMLGLGNHIEMSDSRFSVLGEAAAKTTTNPFYVSGLNISYSDTGLFGAYIVGQPEEMKSLVKAVVTQMKDACKSISENAVEAAKHKLKAKLMMERETLDDNMSAMSLDVANHGKIMDVKELEQAIDGLKAADIKAVAGRVMKAKPAMASLGRLHATPHVDELL